MRSVIQNLPSSARGRRFVIQNLSNSARGRRIVIQNLPSSARGGKVVIQNLSNGAMGAGGSCFRIFLIKIPAGHKRFWLELVAAETIYRITQEASEAITLRRPNVIFPPIKSNHTGEKLLCK